MTPLVLLDRLKEFLESATKDILLPTYPSPGKENRKRAPEIWRMRLPDRPAETKKAPYILLQLLNGTDNQEMGENPTCTCNIRIIAGVYCEDDNEGALNVLNIITRMRLALLKKRIVGNQFTLQLPLEYLVYPDTDTAPFFFGEMMTTWEMPAIKREVPEIWQN